MHRPPWIPPASDSPGDSALLSPRTEDALLDILDRLASFPLLSTPIPAARTMAEEEMLPPDYASLIKGPRSYNPVVKGWSGRSVAENHQPEVRAVIENNPEKCLAAVILMCDFHDRGRGPGAIKAAFQANNITDTNDIDVYPPTPHQVQDTRGAKGHSKPLTNIIYNTSPAFRAMVLASPVFHYVHDGVPISFYCLEVRPEQPFIMLVYTGLSDFTTTTDLLDALYETITADNEITQMVTADHSNIPGDHTPKFVMEVALRFANITTYNVRPRAGRFGPSPPILAHRILISPISTDEMATRRLQARLMRAGFSFPVPLRGIAKPWLGPDERRPEPMACSQCIGVDHYNDDCPIYHSSGFREIHADTAPNSTSASLTVEPDITAANEWTSVPTRGGGRGRSRGERGGGRPYRGAGRSYGGYGGGYAPYAPYGY
ncbi:hypothetical protein MVEN_00165400 [Mycena venus]|uniref:Uncharacterized protein n=1 Tax=Mycena venus TaxID=2733690 RepID=A0A8H7DD11_9AGAR|nr:hypothetical protein MVEN_00165400 [Mycena venus]